MRRTVLSCVFLFVALGCWNASAQQGADPADRLENSRRHHEWVDIESPGGRKVKTWVVYPEVDRPATTVIVIHENRGLTDWVRGVADQLAEAGYLALAPDFLSGTAPGGGGTAEYGSEDAARNGIGRLPAEQVTSDLDAVVKHAKTMPASNKVVAVAGFCWGGGKAFASAFRSDIAAAFVFYGSAPSDEAAYEHIQAPVYGFYGGNDFRITGAVPNVEKRMEQLGKKFEPVVYEGAGHGFMRQGEMTTDANNPDRKARDQGWERWKKILAGLKPAE
ncbi:MAG TPA: dienelactone hydrolase family protein [Lacipirellulaceae bacterium]|nr:dienelactone hydrolase family protein [Lacipirellulaceae bacterium]